LILGVYDPPKLIYAADGELSYPTKNASFLGLIAGNDPLLVPSY
jgi:hypothetical protein